MPALLPFVLGLACGSGEGDADGTRNPSTTPGGEASSGGTAGAAARPAGGDEGSASTGSASAGAGRATGGSDSAGGSSAGGSANAGPITCRMTGDGKTTITFVNDCDALLSFRGSDIDGGDLVPGAHACRDIGDATQSISAVRYWGFIGADPGGEKHTLAELTLNTDFNDFDWYDISHVDAHNLPLRIQPVDEQECRTLTCAESLLEGCPAEGQLEDENGQLISCFSPDRDDPDSVVAQYFEASCDDAYSWSGDDSESMAACAGEDYDIVFCP